MVICVQDEVIYDTRSNSNKNTAHCLPYGGLSLSLSKIPWTENPWTGTTLGQGPPWPETPTPQTKPPGQRPPTHLGTDRYLWKHYFRKLQSHTYKHLYAYNYAYIQSRTHTHLHACNHAHTNAHPPAHTQSHAHTLTFRSLWTTCLLWQYSTARMICQNSFLACGSWNLPCLDMYSETREIKPWLFR